MFVIVCVGLAGRTFTQDGKLPPKGQFLEHYDPEAHHGRGDATWTEDIDAAMKFPDVQAAWRCWAATPANRPRRGDGRPNRPLTAFSIMVAPEEDFTK